MVEYRRSAHAVFDIKYHVAWIAKYRYKVLRGRVAERARDVTIMRGAISPDRIPMLLSAPAPENLQAASAANATFSRTRTCRL
ncbi:MAG: transposase [Bryobacteraceae bacterium]